MSGALDVLILRDPRESIKKCSLTPLRGMEGVRFIEYESSRRVEASGRVFLHPEGELLSEADGGLGLFLIDCSWRRVPQLMKMVDGDPQPRRLPKLETAYPRKSRVFEDPDQGLASVEALYAALALMGHEHRELLAEYRWAGQFLEMNPSLAL
ncbi:MAG: pre-rRNA-processing protein TSR3 [Planctomycetota bacterium]|jgi:pre-rRNA-processing protein TSR3